MKDSRISESKYLNSMNLPDYHLNPNDIVYKAPDFDTLYKCRDTKESQLKLIYLLSDIDKDSIETELCDSDIVITVLKEMSFAYVLATQGKPTIMLTLLPKDLMFTVHENLISSMRSLKLQLAIEAIKLIDNDHLLEVVTNALDANLNNF